MRRALLIPLLALLVLPAACHRKHKTQRFHGPTVAAARVAKPPVIDGHLSEHAWLATGRSSPFVDKATGRKAPYTELRALWDKNTLYIGLYVADQDMELSDRVGVVLTAQGHSLAVAIDPSGKLHFHGHPSIPGVRGAVFTEDTIGNPKDDDEEWTGEIAIPWRALGVKGPCDVEISASRRDRPKGAPKVAHLFWQGRLHLKSTGPSASACQPGPVGGKQAGWPGREGWFGHGPWPSEPS